MMSRPSRARELKLSAYYKTLEEIKKNIAKENQSTAEELNGGENANENGDNANCHSNNK